MITDTGCNLQNKKTASAGMRQLKYKFFFAKVIIEVICIEEV